MHSLFWEDNRLFLNNGTVCGVYRLPQLPHENQSESIRKSIYRQLLVLFLHYHGKGQILSITRPIPPEQIAEKMNGISEHQYWQDHVQATAEMIERTGTYERASFLIVPLASSHSVAWDAVLDRPDLLRERLVDQGKRFLGFLKRKVKNDGIPILTEAELEAAKKADVRMFNRVQAMIPLLERANPQEVEWVHRSPYFRGLSEVLLRLPASLPHTVSVTGEGVTLRPHPLRLALTPATVHEDTFRLRVKHASGEVSYQSILAAASMTEDMEIIGDEWLYQPLEHLEFPIDACIHFEILPSKRAREQVYRKKKIVQGQEEEFGKVGDIPLDVFDGLDDALGLEAKLKAGMSLAQFQVFYAVGAGTELELLHREERLKERLEGVFQLVHPPGEALRLWQAFFPGMMDGVQKSWMIPADPSVLACSGLLGTMKVGDPIGQWLGYDVHNQSPVFADWYRAMRELNRSGAIAWVGTPGSGKSVGMKYACDIMMQWDAMGVVIDPKQGEYVSLVNLWKNECSWWQFGAHSHLSFTPFHLGKDANESRQIAEGFLSVLLNVTSRREDQRATLVVRRALDRLYKGAMWDMPHFLEALEVERHEEKRLKQERELADLFYELLVHYKHDPVGRTIFGEDGQGNIDSTARLTVVSIMGLDLPDPNTAANPDQWRESHRFAVSILYLVTQLGFRRLAAAPAHIPKFFDIDEAWILRAIPEGSALLNQMILLGRSMNLVLLMAVQNPDVLLPKPGESNDDLTANLGWVFVGRLTSKIQVQHAVQLLGLPDEEGVDYIEKFQSFENGRGYLRDPLGRIGEIQIEVLPSDLLQVFDTQPVEKGA